MGTATSGATPIDGRTARRLENRNRILDAALDLTAEGDDIDLEKLAARANVSVRSVYNHFPSARDLVRGMYERGTARIQPYLTQLPGPDVPLDERVKRWVRVWTRIQEEIASIRWRALVAEDRHPELQPELEDLRKRHRAEIRRVFPEIDDRVRQAAAVALTDSLTWRAMRKHQGLSVEAATNVLEETIRRLAR